MDLAGSASVGQRAHMAQDEDQDTHRTTLTLPPEVVAKLDKARHEDIEAMAIPRNTRRNQYVLMLLERALQQRNAHREPTK